MVAVQEKFPYWAMETEENSREQVIQPSLGGDALHCTALHSTELHCTALHCTALHCTALHCR